MRAALCLAVVLVWLAASGVVLRAQQASPPPSPGGDGSSGVWLTGGVAFSTMRGDCQTCEEDFPYRRGPGVLANIGYRVNQRMDVGAEVFWIPISTDGSQEIHTTNIDAVAQFRPWGSKGFFIKGGAGMAFVRNWIDATGGSPITSKALSVVIGGGWAFRPAQPVGLQLFVAQHAVALGDFQTATADVQDVLANVWSVGVAVVIR